MQILQRDNSMHHFPQKSNLAGFKRSHYNCSLGEETERETLNSSTKNKMIMAFTSKMLHDFENLTPLPMTLSLLKQQQRARCMQTLLLVVTWQLVASKPHVL